MQRRSATIFPARAGKVSLSRVLAVSYLCNNLKTLIVHEGQPCSKCGTPVVKRVRRKDQKLKPGQRYYFDWWFRCPRCAALYMVESAKKFVLPESTDRSNRLFNNSPRRREEREGI